MSPAIAVPGRVIFRREIAQAKHLGFALEVARAPHSVTVQLVPITRRAAIVCRRQGAAAIEAACAVGAEDQRLDATREAIRCALELAKDVGA